MKQKIEGGREKIKDGDEFELNGIKIKAKNGVPKDIIMSIDESKFEFRRATDDEEFLSDQMQVFLEIAEGKRDIETWNDEIMVFMGKVSEWKDQELQKAKASERQRCVEAIENNMPKYLKGGEIRNQYFAKGWNEAIDQAKHNLEQMK